MKKTERKDHGEAQRIHFKNRIEERFGLTVNFNGYWKIMDAIRGEKSSQVQATYLFSDSRNRHVYHVDYGEKEFIVVFASNTQEIVTVFPEKNIVMDRWNEMMYNLYQNLLEEK